MIYNKSAHPVEVKKISIRMWSLRDEVEAAIDRRIKECEAAGVPLYIDDIKEFYKLSSPQDSNVLALKKPSSEGQEETEAKEEAQASVDENETPASEETPSESPSENSTDTPALNQAEGIIAEQSSQGLDTSKPNPILNRPYQRQAPDLEKISYGFVLLSDINMSEMLCFAKDKFIQGQSIVVEFLIPKQFCLSANINYCHFYAMRSRIISSSRPDYRIQTSFTFLNKGERENLRSFLKSIEPSIVGEKKKSPSTTTDESLGV